MKKNVEGNVENMYGAKVLHSNESHVVEIKDAEGLVKGDKLLITTRYGKDLAIFLGPVTSYSQKEDGLLQTFLRRATAEDVDAFENNFEKEKKAMIIFKKKVAEQKLEMKPVSAHYLVEEKKILFFFTAETRVDFRELVKELVAVFKMRIELRQIGVRDESRVVGGVAVCGRPYCCHRITDRLQSVSIKMAKEQNLSLNSMKISGPCGRLLCCLSYEYEFYKEEKKRLPQLGAKINIKRKIFKIVDVNIQSGKITLLGDDGRKIDVHNEYFFRENEKSQWKLKADFEEIEY